MPRRVKGLKKKSDDTVVLATAKREIKGSCLDLKDIKAGTKLEIARVIRTPAGLSFRIKNTLRWVREEDLEVDVKPNQIYDYTGTKENELIPESWLARNSVKRKKSNDIKVVSKKTNKTRKTSTKTRIRFVTNNNKPSVARKLKGTLGMDKQKLRQALTGLQPEDRLTVTFLGEKAGLSDDYIVVRTKKGRGKGGSQLVELRASTGEILTTGTPESDLILHVITPDGTLHGYETAVDVPPMFETDAGAATTLKETFKTICDSLVALPKEAYTAPGGRSVSAEGDTRSRFAPVDGTTVRVKVESTHEPFDGVFTLQMVELKRGRYGKVELTVTTETGETVVLDSFQHSGVITSVTVLN